MFCAARRAQHHIGDAVRRGVPNVPNGRERHPGSNRGRGEIHRRVKQQPVTFACDDSVRTAAKHFQAARFDLRYSHYKANGALEAMLAEVVARSLMTGNGRLALSAEEDAAVGRYLKSDDGLRTEFCRRRT